MRKWIGLIFVILLILVLLPAAFGLLAKKTLDQIIKDLPMPEGVTLSLENYIFGWLNSYVAIKIHVEPNAQRSYWADHALDVHVHGHIIHGPLFSNGKGLQWGLARLDTHATLNDIQGLSENTRQELAALFDDRDLLHASSIIHLNRDVEINLQSSPISAQTEGDVLQWNGINGQIKINKDFTQLHTTITTSPMLFTTQKGAVLDSAAAQFTAQLHRAATQQPWIGEQKLNLPTFYLKDETGAVLRFDHLNVISESNIIDDIVEASLDIAADNIEVNHQKIDQTRFDLKLSNFAKEPLIKLGQLIHQPQGNANKKEMMALMTQALMPGADVKFDYLLNMEQKQVLVHVLLNFPDVRDKAAQSASENAQELLKKSNAQIEIMVPQQILKDLLLGMVESTLSQQVNVQELNPDQVSQLEQMIDEQITLLVQNNVIRAQDDNYYFDFSYYEGNMTLNEKPLTQQEVFLLFMLISQVIPNESITH